MPPLDVDPKVDYAFKKTFGSEDTKEVLAHLLNAVLQPPAGSEVVDLVVLNPFNDKQTTADKWSVLDIKARDARGRTYHVEMQMAAWWAFPSRLLYYWSRAHGAQLSEGEDFRALRPTISVCFVGNQLFRDVAGHHHTFSLIDPRTGSRFTEDIAIHVVELGKFELGPCDLKTPLDIWCYFLKHGATLDPASLPAALDVPIIRRAMEVLKTMTQSEMERAQYESRHRARLEELTREREMQELERQMDDVRRQADDARRQADDAFVARVHIAERALRRAVTAKDDLLRLTPEARAELAARLERELEASLAGGPASAAGQPVKDPAP